MQFSSNQLLIIVPIKVQYLCQLGRWAEKTRLRAKRRPLRAQFNASTWQA